MHICFLYYFILCNLHWHWLIPPPPPLHNEHYFMLNFLPFFSATPVPAANSPMPYLGSRPTEKELLAISRIIIPRWESVCIELGIDAAKRSEYKQNNLGNTQQACFDALLWWSQNAESATWAALLEAMRSGGFKDPAAKVEANLQNGTELNQGL